MGAAPAVGEPALQSPEESWSRFSRTVWYLQRSEPQQQADFTADALNLLAEVYYAEADLARTEAREQSGSARAKLLGWSQAVDQYANQLMLVLEDVGRGAEVTLLQGHKGAVTATIADRAVILEHPRHSQQAAYERRVLSEFCSTNDCNLLTARANLAEPIPMSPAGIKPQWIFTQDGQLCTHDGIQVSFGSGGTLGTLRGLCEELVREALTLANEIAWQQRHGVNVDWGALLVSITPQRPEHLVRLNTAGDSILVTLPLLYGSPGLLEDLQPWLRYRVSRGEKVEVLLDAASYGWLEAGQ